MTAVLPHLMSVDLFVGESIDERAFARPANYYAIEYFIEDGGTIEINNNVFPIHRGLILVVRPNDMRKTVLPSSCLFVHLNQVTGAVQEALEELPTVMFSEDPFFEKVFNDMAKKHREAGIFAYIEKMGLLLQLVSKLHELSPQSLNQNKNISSLVSGALRYISAHYSEDITVSSVAAHCHVSESYLHKLFVRQIGCAPYEAILNHRIRMAKLLLRGREDTLEEIAVKCGFHSQSRFTMCFKDKVGITPGRYRQSANNKLPGTITTKKKS